MNHAAGKHINKRRRRKLSLHKTIDFLFLTFSVHNINKQIHDHTHPGLKKIYKTKYGLFICHVG